jgi:hypothetical protein
MLTGMHTAAWRAAATAVAVLSAPATPVFAQATKLAVLQAEDRRASTLQDLTTLRVAARSLNPEVARAAVRALGRLERPSLVPDIAQALRNSVTEVRAEAANALAQATQSIRTGTPPGTAVAAVQTALSARLDQEAASSVRAVICEALGRLPYASDGDAARGEAALIACAAHATSSTDRLGVVKGLEAFTRLEQSVHRIGDAAIRICCATRVSAASRSKH